MLLTICCRSVYSLQLAQGGDEETTARAALVLAKATVEVALDNDKLDLLGVFSCFRGAIVWAPR